MILFSLSFSYSTFVIYNSDLDPSNVFSLQDLDFYVSSNTNAPIELSYDIEIGNTTQKITKQLLLVSCNVNSLSTYCLKDSFLNYMNSTNTTFTTALEYTFKRGSSTRNVNLDFLNPQIVYNFSFNENDNLIELDLIVEDNTNLEINTEIVISTLLNSNNIIVYNKSITSNSFSNQFEIRQGGEYKLEISSTDKAGNNNQAISNLTVDDIFAPQIRDIIVTHENNEKIIEFEIEDENTISSWQFNSKTKLYGENFQDEKNKQFVSTPFIFDPLQTKLEVKDELNNSRSIDLPRFKEIEISSNEKYSKSLSIQTKFADSCVIVSGLGSKKIELEKKGNEFITSLSSYSQRKYSNVKVECRNSNFKIVELIDFEIDTTPPEIESFEVLKNEDGGIDLLFEASEDTRKINIHRNDNVITTLNEDENSYTDTNAKYPKTYEYRIEVLDDINNNEFSDEIEIVPNKVEIYFDVSYEDLGNNVRVIINSETGLIGYTSELFNIENQNNIQLNKNDKLNRFDFTTNSKNSELQIKKQLEDIRVSFVVRDSLGNEDSESIFIPKREISTFEIVENATLDFFSDNNINTNINQNSTIESNENMLFWIIFIFIILAIIFIVILLVSRNNFEVKALINSRKKLDTRKKIKNKPTKNKDFQKTLDKVTSKRISEKIAKDEIKKKEELEKKRKRLFNQKTQSKKNTHYQTSKYDDLNKNSNKSLFKKDFTLKSNYNDYNIVKSDLNKKSPSKLKGIMTYSHSFMDNLISKVVDKEDVGTKRLSNSYVEKNIDSTRKNIFSTEDSMKFKLSRNELLEERKEKIEKRKAEEEKKRLEEVLEQQQKKEEKEIKKEVKSNIEWGNYLEKKSKSRKWFLIQKEVQREVENDKRFR